MRTYCPIPHVTPISVHCLICDRRLSFAVAGAITCDADGPAFKAYYCADHAPDAAAHEVRDPDARITHFLPYGTARTVCGIRASSAIRTDYRVDRVTCPRCRQYGSDQDVPS